MSNLTKTKHGSGSYLKENALMLVIVSLSILLASWIAWSYFNTEYISKTEYVPNARARYNPLFATELLLNKQAAGELSSQTNNQQANQQITGISNAENLTTDQVNNDNVNSDSVNSDTFLGDSLGGDPLSSDTASNETGEYDSLDYGFATSQQDMDAISLINNLDSMYSTDNKRPVLLINKISSSLSDKKYQQLMSWVENGGHLITFAQHSNYVNEEDWQKIEERINELKQDGGDTAILSDSQLNDLLSNASDTPHKNFLQSLNIYQHDKNYPNANTTQLLTRLKAFGIDDIADISIKNSDAIQELLDESEFDLDVEDIEDAINNVQNQQTPETNQQKSKIKPPKKEKKPKKSINMAKVGLAIKELYNNVNSTFVHYQPTQTVVNKPLNKFINASNTTTNVFSHTLFYARNPNAKPVNQFTQLSANHIRQQLQQERKLLATAIQKIKQTPKSSLTDDALLHHVSLSKVFRVSEIRLNLLEIQKTYDILVQLPDHDLTNIFGGIDSLMLDSYYGDGRITVLSDETILKNPDQFVLENTMALTMSGLEKLSLLDDAISPNLLSRHNADLLLALTADSSEVWLFSKVDIDALPVMLWKKSTLALLGLLLLVIVWIWSLSNRFGKPQQIATTVSHDILRYFQQIGRYGWQQDKAKKLTKVTRSQVHQTVKSSLAIPKQQALQQSHLPELQTLLRSRLAEKITNLQQLPHAQAQVVANLRDNEHYVQTFLTTENLVRALLPTANDFDNMKSTGFTEYTQTLWLIKWILK